MDKPPQVKMIQSINRAVDILEALCASDEPLTLTELTDRLKLNKTTIFHLIKTLEYRNYVVMDQKTNRYRLGLRVFELGQAVEKTAIVLDLALPLMREIRDKYNETLHLGVVQESGSKIYATYIEKVETTNPIRLASRIGRHVPLHCTALGKLFLSYQPREHLAAILGDEPLQRYSDTTITSYGDLLEELEKSRLRGWFFDNQEYEPGVHCIAVPVLDSANRAIAGVSISMPAPRLTKTLKSQIVDDMIAVSKRLSSNFGG